MIEMKLTIDATPALLEAVKTFASAFSAGVTPAPAPVPVPAPVEEPAENTAEEAPAPAPEPVKKAPAKKTAKKAPAKKAAPKEEAPAPEPAPAPTLTLNDLTRTGADFIDKTGRVEDLTTVLQKKYGVVSMVNLDPARYADFADDLARLAAGESAKQVIG